MFSFGVFFTPILEEFGWDRALLSGVMTVHGLMHGSISLIAGRLTDRIGPRVALVISGIAFGTGTLLMAQVNTIWELYLYGGVLRGIGMGFCVVPLTSIIARWFYKRRNLMMGTALSGMGTGMLIMPLVINSLIAANGWRDTAYIMGIVAVVVIVIAAQFLKRDPAQMGLLPDGAGEVDTSNLKSTGEGYSFAEAIRTPQFRVVAIAYVSTGFAASAAMVHVVPHAIEMGISAANAATVMAVIGGVSVASRLTIGGIADKIGGRSSLIISITLAVCSIILLLFASELWMLYIFAVLFGFGQGGMSVTMSPIIAELFGLKQHGTIQGFTVFIMTFATAVSPVLAGRLFDISGSYMLDWLVFGCIGTVGVVLTLILRNTGRGSAGREENR
jgi:MFS family permease